MTDSDREIGIVTPGPKEEKPDEEKKPQDKVDEGEADIPLPRVELAAVQSNVHQDSNNYFSEAPPPSPEKTRRRRQKNRDDAAGVDTGFAISNDLSQRSGLELEVEALLDNSNRWRKSRQARIRTPVRRAVLSYGVGSPGRRQQVLCDLNAKVRELEVAALSRGIVCSLQTVVNRQEARHPRPGGGAANEAMAVVAGAGTQQTASGESLTSRLDPRVRGAYQMLSKQNGQVQRQSQEAAVRKSQHISSWHDSGRLQSRGRIRASGGFARESTTATTTSSSGCRPQRVKTSLTIATAPLSSTNSWAPATSVTRADLLRLQTINGEVQRSLYTERTPELRRLLYSGSDVRGVGGIRGIYGVGAGSFNIPRMQDRRREKSLACPPATATGLSRIELATYTK